MGILTDEAIIEKVLSGNTHIFSVLIDKYKDKMFSMSYGFTNDYNEAQDLSQEIFINAFKNLHKFNGQSKFYTWLYKVSYNLCIDWNRKNKKRFNFLKLFNGSEEDIVDHKNIEDKVISKLNREYLRSAVKNLDEKYKTVLILFHFQGLSYEEIGEVLSLSVKTVETRLYRGREKLRKQLSKHYDGGESYEMQRSDCTCGQIFRK